MDGRPVPGDESISASARLSRAEACLTVDIGYSDHVVIFHRPQSCLVTLERGILKQSSIRDLLGLWY